MSADLTGTIQQLDFPFTPSPSGTGLTVFTAEERFNAYAVSCGYTPSLHDPARVECASLMTVRGVVQLIAGYPNEEAFWQDPRGHLGHGVFEIIGSDWIDRINDYNVASFGSAFIGDSSSKRHFFVGGKDASAQFLADDISLELFTEVPLLRAYRAARDEALRRLDGYPEP